MSEDRALTQPRKITVDAAPINSDGGDYAQAGIDFHNYTRREIRMIVRDATKRGYRIEKARSRSGMVIGFHMWDKDGNRIGANREAEA